LPYNRICFSLFKGFGNAVSRNRAKRLGREAYRLMKNRLSGGYDLFLLFYPKAEENCQKGSVLSDRTAAETAVATGTVAARQLESLFKKAGLLK
jgi:RNase P protein component